MRLKNWVSITVFLFTSGMILNLFMTDNILLNIFNLIGAAINVSILTKYSKFCDIERRR